MGADRYGGSRTPMSDVNNMFSFQGQDGVAHPPSSIFPLVPASQRQHVLSENELLYNNIKS